MTQHLVLETRHTRTYVATNSSEQVIHSARDFLDIVAWGGEHDTDLFLLHDANFVPEFYDLSTGTAGDIIQEISNYRVRVAIFGPFSMVRSKRFREFMGESNRGSSVSFLGEKAKALEWLLA